MSYYKHISRLFLNLKVILTLMCFSCAFGSHSQCVLQGLFPIPDLGQNSTSITVSGLANGDLGVAGQALCGVRIKFLHSSVGDVDIFLQSPSGQVIELTGPQASTAITSFTTWDVTFLPCSDAVAPDPGFADQWSNDQPWAILSAYTGTYYPFLGCLEDLTGSANGLWVVIATDNQVFDDGLIEEIELIFCDPTGQVCMECGADAGELPTDTMVQCTNGNPAPFDLMPFFPNGQPEADYAYFYIVSYNGIVIEVTSQFDHTSLPSGNYAVCGASLFHIDTTILKTFPPNLSITNFLDFARSNIVCVDFSDECAVLEVKTPQVPAFSTLVICEGDTVYWGDDTLTAPGTYPIMEAGNNGCLRLHTLSLTVLNPAAEITVDTAFSCVMDVASLSGRDTTFGSMVDFYWYNSGGQILTDERAQQIKVRGTGTYFLVTIKSVGSVSCSDTSSIVLIDDFEDVQVSYLGDTISCAMDSVVVSSFSTLSDAIIIWRDNQTGVEDTLRTKTIYWGDDYTLIGVSQQGCTQEVRVLLPYDTIAPATSALDIDKICRDDSVILAPVTLDLDLAYGWILPQGDTIRQPVIRTDENGLFGFYSIARNGCAATDAVEVRHTGLNPQFQIASDTFGCLTDSILLNITSNLNEVSFDISGPGPFASNDRDVYIRELGSYLIQVETINGCFYDTTWKTPFLQDLDTVLISGGILNCLVDSVQLIPAFSGDQHNYQWSGPSTFSSALPAPFVYEAGSYDLSMTTPTGCVLLGSSSVEIDTMRPMMDRLQADSIDCLKSDATLSVQLDIDEMVEWIWPDDTRTNLSVFTTMLAGTYQVVVTNIINGCVDSASVLVVVDTMGIDNMLSGDREITCLTSEARIISSTSSLAATLDWIGPGIIFMDENSITVDQAGVYILTATLSNGCFDVDSFTVVGDTIPAAITLTGDTIRCDEMSVQLGFESDQVDISYEWFGPEGFSSLDSLPMVQTAGYYRIEVSRSNGCMSIDSALVVADTMSPTLIVQAGLFSCTDTTTMASATVNPLTSQISWNGPGMFMGMGDQIPLDRVGDYIVSATASNGCVALDTFTFDQFDTIDDASLTTDTITCAQAIGDYQVSTSEPNVTYEWYEGPDLASITSGLTSGFLNQIQVIITNAAGCQWDTSFVPIVDTIAPNPSIEMTGVVRCQNLDFDLAASNLSLTENYDYTWSSISGQIISTIDLSQIAARDTGIYQLDVTNTRNGCIGSADIQVVAEESELTIGGVSIQQPTCNNGYESVVEINNITGNTGFISYYLDNVLQGIDSVLNSLSGGNHIITVEDEFGCQDTISVEIDEAEFRFVNIERDTVLRLGDAILLQPFTNISSSVLQSINWTINGDLVCEDCDTLALQVVTAGYYAVIIQDTSGCIVSDSVFIKVVSIPAMYIPTAFSPNDDGTNDLFGPFFGNNVLLIQDFSIYSRWGEKLYVRTNMSPDNDQLFWDGSADDEALNPGTFVYSITIELIDGRVIQQSGDFHLIR